ncbi:MAG: SpoVA/SpoVAEb family sporulation membrane protein [Oscillospiraceae bacterium]|jgi:stage V sporulation protein AC|nr:SpoVA/SpoVAEb family sporulation membrane protein [Oscillospiraceae bacterium]
MNITKDEYKKLVEETNPKTKSYVNIPVAFLSGGFICAIGEVLAEFYKNFFSTQTSLAYTSMTLIVLSALLTGLNIYPKIAKHTGAGTLVPVTGFSNSITSSALEAKSEGFILGVGAKIFTIAGPVLLYGIIASTLYGFFLVFS